MQELKELKAWIEEHQKEFQNYLPEEIANVAIAAGFSRITVAQWEAQVMFKAGSHGR